MENLINEVLLKLDNNLDVASLANIKQILYSVLNDYDINKKETLPAIRENPIPDELKYYMVSKKIEGLSEASLKQYWNCLKDLFETINKPVNEITVADLRIYLYNYQKEHNIADITLETKRLYLHTFFEWCMVNGYISKNPCSLINTIKYDKKERQPLTDLEMEQLRHACTKYNEKAIVALDDYIKSKNKPSEYIFSSRRNPNTHITSRAVESMVKTLGEKALIPDRVFLHRIRHTTATDALDRGMSIEQVQTLLGHEKTSTTLIYAKVNQAGVKNESLRCIV